MSGENLSLKEKLIAKLSASVESSENQKDSQEYKDSKAILDEVTSMDFNDFEETLAKIQNSDSSAYGFLTIWGKNNDNRIYFNVSNRKGYKYPIKNNMKKLNVIFGI